VELGKRERQIMDVVYRLGRATVAEVRDGLEEPPTYSAVRGMLRFLEEKGHLRHVQEGVKYVYLPTVAPSKARRSALQRLVRTFFAGSTRDAVAALLEEKRLGKDDLDRLQKLIAVARKEGR
jgi:predicted transcriptional regulator